MICKVKIDHNNAPFVIGGKQPRVLNTIGIKQEDLRRNMPFTLSFSRVLDEGAIHFSMTTAVTHANFATKTYGGATRCTIS